MVAPAHILVFLPLAVMAASSRAKPVVMPFGAQYGIGPSSSWFSVPLEVAGQKFNLSISNTHPRTWIPSSNLCSSAKNKTECGLWKGGMLSSAPGGEEVLAVKELETGVYNTSLAKMLYPALKGDSQTLLGMKGKGVLTEEEVRIKSNTGAFELKEQSIGVFKSEAPAFNGLLSLQQLALGLFEEEKIPGPNYHLLIGASAQGNGSSPPDSTYDAGEYVLIFGGYDETVWDLNKTQQYPLRKTTMDGDDVGYRMEAPVEDIVYRWTNGGDTDNSLIPAPSTVIIDTTTPYLWLPQKALDSLLDATGTVWNETMNSYVFSGCFSDCTDAEDTTSRAVLDFKFPTHTVTIPFKYLFQIQSLWFESLWVENRPVVPIRPLKDENAPIILGRAAMAGIHLWVDYADEYFGLQAANSSAYLNPKVVPWSKESHPPITNTTILATPIAASSSSSDKSDKDSTTEDPKKLPLPLIAGGTGGAILLLALALLGYCLIKRRRRNRGPRRPLTQTVGPSELHNDEYYKLQEIDGRPHANELPSKPHVSELPPKPYVAELPQKHYVSELPPKPPISYSPVPPASPNPVMYEMPAQHAQNTRYNAPPAPYTPAQPAPYTPPPPPPPPPPMQYNPQPAPYNPQQTQPVPYNPGQYARPGPGGYHPPPPAGYYEMPGHAI